MALENKLGLTDSAELARAEEKISKTKCRGLFEKGLLDTFEIGTFAGLCASTNISLMKSMTLPEKCGRSISPRAGSGSPR